MFENMTKNEAHEAILTSIKDTQMSLKKTSHGI